MNIKKNGGPYYKAWEKGVIIEKDCRCHNNPFIRGGDDNVVGLELGSEESFQGGLRRNGIKDDVTQFH